MITPHGSYIFDVPSARKTRLLLPEEAVNILATQCDPDLMKNHLKYEGALRADDKNLMLNKTWIGLFIGEDGNIVCIYNADLQYMLVSIPRDEAIKYAHQPTRATFLNWLQKKGVL